MEFKNNRPLIFVMAALTLAVVILAVQVVNLTFTVQEQKDALRMLTSANDTVSLQNKFNNLQSNVLDLSRDLEVVKNNHARVSNEVNSMQGVVNKVGNDSQFLQQELTNFDDRISALEKRANNIEYSLDSLERAARYQQ